MVNLNCGESDNLKSIGDSLAKASQTSNTGLVMGGGFPSYPTAPSTCPCCGYCPTCGRQNYYKPVFYGTIAAELH